MYLCMPGNQTRVGTMIQFHDNSTTLDEAAAAQLNAFVPLILGKPNKIEIRGHASRKALVANGEPIDTWQLCYARCQATMDFLVKEGIKPARIRLSQAGLFEPSERNVDDTSDDPNPRVEVLAISAYARGSA